MLPFLNQYAGAFVAVGLEVALKGTLVLAAGAGITMVGRKWSAAARHLVWVGVVATLLVLPAAVAVVPGWNILPALRAPIAPQATIQNAPKVEIPAEPQISTSEAAPSVILAPPLPPHPTIATNTDAVIPARIEGVRISWHSWCFAVWMFGAVAAVAPILFATLWLRRIERHARAYSDWSPPLREAKRLFRVARPVEMLASDRIAMPMTFGIIRGRIVLPAAAFQWHPERMRMVVMHEMAHIKRLDVLTHLLARAACAMYWFHPLVWLSIWWMTLERERACDDLVVNASGEPRIYAETLIEMARTFTRREMMIGGIAMARKSTLESRVRAVMDARCNRRSVRGFAATAATALSLLLAVPLGMLHTSRAQAEPDERPLPSTGQVPVPETPSATSPVPANVFSDGTTIELLGITRNPQTGPWWLSDGSPTIPAVTPGLEATSNDNTFLLRAKSLHESDARLYVDILTKDGLRQLSPTGPENPGIRYFSAWETSQLSVLRIGMPQGAWKKQAELTWEGSAKTLDGQIAIGARFEPVNTPGAGVVDMNPVIPGPAPEQAKSAVVVTVAYTYDPRKFQWRLVAIDGDGKEHLERTRDEQGAYPPLRQCSVFFGDLAVGNVKTFRVETRAMEWVEFKDFVADPRTLDVARNAELKARMDDLMRMRDQELAKYEQSKRLADAAAAKAAMAGKQGQLVADATNATADEKKGKESADVSSASDKGFYYVMGDVLRPGVYSLNPQGMTTLQAVVAAGIGKADVEKTRVRIVRQKDGKNVSIPSATMLDLMNEHTESVQSGDIVWVGMPSARVEELEKQRSELQMELSIISSTHGGNDAQNQAIKERINAVERQLDELDKRQQQTGP